VQGDFVDVPWLLERLGDARVRVVDARSVPHGGVVAMPSGREQFAAGHDDVAIRVEKTSQQVEPFRDRRVEIVFRYELLEAAVPMEPIVLQGAPRLRRTAGSESLSPHVITARGRKPQGALLERVPLDETLPAQPGAPKSSGHPLLSGF